MRARRLVSIPAQDDLFRWQVGAPFGVEKLTVICTKEPLLALSGPDVATKRFGPVARSAWNGIGAEIDRQPSSDWGIDEVEITTYPRSQEDRDPGRKRVGLFIGVGYYQFHDAAAAAYGRGLNVPACQRDARVMADLLREVADISEARVLTNEQATRRNIEESVTGWLRQTTRPGDTIFIFFAGHGGKLRDDNGDEQDGVDESIIPHDFLTLGMLDVLERQLQAATLDPSQLAAVRNAQAIRDRAGSRERAALALERDTAITDDVFGHWMQALDGRQIAVIVVSCHSGGLATAEKDLAAKAPGFDFLDREMGRLKDLGQRELVLLSAAGTNELAFIRVENDLTVLTYYLVEAIRSAPARLTLEDGYRQTRLAMARYFQEKQSEGIKITPHEPHLFDYTTRPVFLKP